MRDGQEIPYSEHIEVVEGLLRLCEYREREILKLLEELDNLKAEITQLQDTVRSRKSGRLTPIVIKQADIAGSEADSGENRILLVDSNNVMLEKLSGMLSSDGYKIAGKASTGVEAIKLYLSLKPSLITLDLDLPDIDGMDVIRNIFEFDPGAKIIVISNDILGESLLEAIGAGVFDVITKPVRTDRLINSIKSCLLSGKNNKRIKFGQTGSEESPKEQSQVPEN